MYQKVFRSIIVSLLVIGLVAVQAPTPVQAATLTVTNNNDSGQGSLRQAILDANDGDTIEFDANYTITLNSKLPIIDKTLNITGRGAENTIIEASDCNPVTLPGGCTPANDRVFEIDSTGNLTLDGVTVRHGRCGFGTSCSTINFAHLGGGILNQGILVITNSSISGNSVYGYGGGGIFNEQGVLTITNSTFSGNSLVDNGGTDGGGAIHNSNGTLTVMNSYFANNSSETNGGAIKCFRGTTTITDSTFSNNNAGTSGGGIAGCGGTVTDSSFFDNGAGTNGGAISGAGTVTNSTFSGNSAIQNGGGIYQATTVTNSIISGNSAGTDGGGIHNFFTMTITNSTLSGNSAGRLGGGIYNSFNLTITNSTLSGNTADLDGGGVHNSFDGLVSIYDTTVSSNSSNTGGGILNNGNVSLNNSVVSENITTTSGSGIRNLGRLTLRDTTVMNNSATGNGVSGAGIANEGLTEMFNSSIVGNTSTNIGAGIGNWGLFRIVNSTVSGNSPGGIVNSSKLDMYNTTVTNNISSSVGGGIFNFNIATLSNTIIGGNFGAAGSLDCFGTLTSRGHNLIQNTTGCTISGDTTGNLLGVDPMLGSLQDNGGLTLTHALLTGSPAIDAGDPAGCMDQIGSMLTIDQRNIARPQGAVCDIGAFEFELVMIDVSVDIKPGSDTNPINPKSNGKIPVAILSTPDFDAPSMVDISSLTFGRSGSEASLVSCNENGEDVNGDGLRDLVCHFYTQAAGFQSHDIEGILMGETIDNTPLEGHDVLKILQ